MNMTFRWFAVAALVLLAGCNTPESRIKKDPELFNSFSPAVQEGIRQGKVEVGYTADMVQMSMGEPSRKYFRKTAAGETEIWAYSDYYTHNERQRADVDTRVRDAEGGSHMVRDRVWVDVEQRTEYDKTRIEFGTDGKVQAVEVTER
jgi:outer membrane protein assembly factor BamE (lipoprotein component of BamABCDE complex)